MRRSNPKRILVFLANGCRGAIFCTRLIQAGCFARRIKWTEEQADEAPCLTRFWFSLKANHCEQLLETPIIPTPLRAFPKGAGTYSCLIRVVFADISMESGGEE